jgi:Flp pilus assembly pilin Flp
MLTKKAQSTVEYILLVAAVIAIVVLFTTKTGSGTFQGGLNQVFNQTTQDLLNVTNRLSQ